MRITNGMIINSTLNGLYNNMNALNKTYAQMTTGKKIQTVSDDPIIAGKALKMKTTVLETSQYQTNVKEAQSWTDITESTLDNITKILKTIREKCVNASTGTLNKENKESIRTEIEQLWGQIKGEANNTYEGRYIFSGYKTNQPLVITKSYDISGADFTLNDNMILGDNSSIKAQSELAVGSQISKGSILGAGSKVETGCKLGPKTVLSATDAHDLLGITLDATHYYLDAPKAITEGTKMTEDIALKLVGDLPVGSVSYTVENGIATLTNDVNIAKGQGLTNAVSKALLGVEGSATSYNTTVAIDKTGDYTFSGDVTLGAGSEFIGKITTDGNSVLASNTVVNKDSILKDGSSLGKGTLNPEVVGKISKDNIEYEVGVNSTITVNTCNLDETMVQMAGCFNEIFLKLDKALADDNTTVTDLHNMFTAKLDEIDGIALRVSEATSDLGSRMNRLTYVSSRLTEQKLTYKNLLTETEDVDMEEIYTNFNVQYATYQSALQATSKIITNTLADYL